MFHQLSIADVAQETADAVAITLDVPAELAEVFAFRPGQYLTLRAEVNGEDMRRSYSIAAARGGRLTVGVKKVDGGAFSTFAQGLGRGHVVQVMPPEGRFVVGSQSKLVLVAAGSGITPMVAIAAEALERGAEVTLVYGNRNTGSIMFRGALDDLKDRFVDRFTLIHILSREPQDVALLNGHVTGEKIAALARAGAIDLAGAQGVFLCGPGGMIDDVAGMLAAQGYPREQVHFERFYQDGETQRAPRSAAAAAVAEAGATVEVVLDGTRRQFTVSADDDTVMDAAERAGLELPYSCRGGMCCTCRCKVVEGSAEMATNYSLEPWEMEAGFTLACQTRPTSEKLVLDFDAA